MNTSSNHIYHTNRTIYHFIAHQPDKHSLENEDELIRALANLGGFTQLKTNH